MTLTYDEAIDEIYGLLYAAWQSSTASIAGYVPAIRWAGKEEPEKPDGSLFWARCSASNVVEPQTSLSNCVEQPGNSRYTPVGVVIVQLFCPKSDATAMEKGRLLAQVARNAFRGKTTPGKVWFRNARIHEIEPEDLFYRLNIIAEYEYDEIG